MAQPESDRDREPPAEHKPWFRRPVTVAVLFGGLVLGGFVLAQVGPGVLDWLVGEEHPGFVDIQRLPPEAEERPVNETDLRERMPGLVDVLDEMIETSEEYRSFRITDTTMRWCAEIGEEFKECPARFEYRNVAFRIGLVQE